MIQRPLLTNVVFGQLSEKKKQQKFVERLAQVKRCLIQKQFAHLWLFTNKKERSQKDAGEIQAPQSSLLKPGESRNLIKSFQIFRLLSFIIRCAQKQRKTSDCCQKNAGEIQGNLRAICSRRVKKSHQIFSDFQTFVIRLSLS